MLNKVEQQRNYNRQKNVKLVHKIMRTCFSMNVVKVGNRERGGNVCYSQNIHE